MNLSTFQQFKHVDSDESVVVEGETLRKVQAVLVGMLDDFARMCDEEGLDWCVCGGTCLGQVRHGGFIPWDDDVDVFMTRDSFERLKQVFDEKLGSRYCLHEPSTYGFGLDMGRVRLKNTVYRGMWDIELEEVGLFIDIFILDDVPKNPVARRVHGFFSLALGLVQSCSRFFRYRDSILPLAGDNANLRKVVNTKARIGKLFSFRTMEQWCIAWDDWNKRHHGCGSGLVSCPAGRLHYFGEMYRYEDFFPAADAAFSGITVKVPAFPGGYLSVLYGASYMDPPPESDREAHAIIELDLGCESCREM